MGRATPYEKQAGDRAYESVYGRPPHAQVRWWIQVGELTPKIQAVAWSAAR